MWRNYNALVSLGGVARASAKNATDDFKTVIFLQLVEQAKRSTERLFRVLVISMTSYLSSSC